jgi:hypothetical protein
MRSDERNLVRALLRGVWPEAEIDLRLAHATVQDLSDGGMGSVRFADAALRRRHFGREAAGAEYLDEDGVLVSIALNLDDNSDLFELDLWKADFSPLLRYPSPRDLRIILRSDAKASEAALAAHP